MDDFSDMSNELIESQLNISPFSVNRAWQGRRFRTPEFKQWQKAVLLMMPKMKMIKGEVAVFMKFYLKSIKRSDCDNFIKCILDCCVAKGWIEDDRYIMEINAKKIKRDIEGFEIQIVKL